MDSKATWMGSLPHSRASQVDARNRGKYDKWLLAKQSGNDKYADMPLTLGHYTRRDIPFYYALADAFTVCDQYFCSVLGPTSPNRVKFWSGTLRKEQHPGSTAHVKNGQINYKDLQWKTYPERLEEHNISWKVYQNELSIPVGLHGEEAPWLANFTNNDLEFFKQYNVRLYKEHLDFIKKRIAALKQEISKLKAQSKQGDKGVRKELQQKREELSKLNSYRKKWNPKRFEQLSAFEKSIHRRAFTNNHNDPDYHRLKELNYDYEGRERQMKIPEGDVFYQFRKDVETGNLPTVSWLVAPENYSDHPSAPWYGAWYVSEAINILTQNPDLWKKTILVLNYDENDGYFDHVPPFVAPNPDDSETGFTSKGIRNKVEFVNEDKSSIGLGYRVPMIVVSPWSRGGWVNSQVFDHTSCLQFLERFLHNKTGKRIKETQISDWNRAVCGDLSSVFRKYKGNEVKNPYLIDEDVFLEDINKAQYKDLPKGYRQISEETIERVKQDPKSISDILWQEGGARPACALPYQLRIDGALNAANNAFEVSFEARNEIFGKAAAGAAFNVYVPTSYRSRDSNSQKYEKMRSWDYAVKAGESVKDSWQLNNFRDDNYQLQVYGPNGFFREFRGDEKDPHILIEYSYQRAPQQNNKFTGNVELHFDNRSHQAHTIQITDNAYGKGITTKEIPASGRKQIVLDLQSSYGWYDFTVKIEGYNAFRRQYAGRVETGAASYSDPQIS
jgi:phospholipase C